jgi:hypothetical protein
LFQLSHGAMSCTQVGQIPPLAGTLLRACVRNLIAVSGSFCRRRMAPSTWRAFALSGRLRSTDRQCLSAAVRSPVCKQRTAGSSPCCDFWCVANM